MSAEDKPLGYKVICISMYTEDLARLDAMVESLKARGLTTATRSALIRYALDSLDLEGRGIPRELRNSARNRYAKTRGRLRPGRP